MARLCVLVGAVLLLAASCGGDNDRPSDAAWEQTWELQRGLIPPIDELVAGDTAFCDDLDGRARTALPTLLPTPDESLDKTVQDWIDHAETIAYECPHDRDELVQSLHRLEVLASEIDAGLAEDVSG